MTLHLVRRWRSEACWRGELIVDGVRECYTLEPPPTGAHPCIPVGRYPVSRYESPRFRSTVLLLHDVPGREGIEIHAGNGPDDTSGCILVGRELEEDRVTYSRAALADLLTLIGETGGVLEIVETPDFEGTA